MYNQQFSPTLFQLPAIHDCLWFLVVSYYLCNFLHLYSYSVIQFPLAPGLLERTLIKMEDFFGSLILFFFCQTLDVGKKKIHSGALAYCIANTNGICKVQNRLWALLYFEPPVMKKMEEKQKEEGEAEKYQNCLKNCGTF